MTAIIVGLSYGLILGFMLGYRVRDQQDPPAGYR